jgi:hypothetical protein
MAPFDPLEAEIESLASSDFQIVADKVHSKLAYTSTTPIGVPETQNNDGRIRRKFLRQGVISTTSPRAVA